MVIDCYTFVVVLPSAGDDELRCKLAQLLHAEADRIDSGAPFTHPVFDDGGSFVGTAHHEQETT